MKMTRQETAILGLDSNTSHHNDGLAIHEELWKMNTSLVKPPSESILSSLRGSEQKIQLNLYDQTRDCKILIIL